MQENKITAPLTRFQIEAVLALKEYGSVRKAARHLRISNGSMYNDLLSVEGSTGISPLNKEGLQKLYDAIMEVAKCVKSS